MEIRKRGHHTFIFSGRETAGYGGVGMYLGEETSKALLGYNPISDRVLSMRLQGKPMNITLIQVYAPTSTATQEEIDDFYNSVKQAVDGSPTNDMLVLMGDFNAKIGEGMETGEENIIGSFGLGARNERGESLVSFATENELIVCNTWFKQHKRRLYTWTAPDGKTRNQIDYILVRKSSRTSVTNTRTFPGADCGTDHQLLCMDMRCRIKTRRREKPIERFDVSAIPDAYAVEVKNQYEALTAAADEMTPNELWEETKEATLSVAREHIPKRKRNHSKWMTGETLELIEERRKMKKEGTNIASPEYRKASAKIQTACRRDKKQHLLDKCDTIEAHHRAGNSKAMYAEIKQLTKKFTPHLSVIKNKEGKTLTESEDILERWKEYCSELYTDECKCDEPVEQASDKDINAEHNDDSDLTPLRSEVEQAMSYLKRGKSPGCDGIPAELILAGGEAAVSLMHKLCVKIWETAEWPVDWCRAIFVPLPKKGDLQLCENYRTISLICHASKIMLKIILCRMTKKLKEEISASQAGYMKHRGTRDHIYNLQMLIRKCQEMQQDLFICFVDYSKAFDNARYNQLWNIMTKMALPRPTISSQA